MKKSSHLFIACIAFFLPLVLLPAMASADDPLVGEIKLYSGRSVPDGWLLADGSAISRTYYADLYTVITTTYGVGDGSTTFNIPDLQARFPLGVDSTYTLADTGGQISHTLTIAEMPAHDHDIVAAVGGSGGITGVVLQSGVQFYALFPTQDEGGGEPHNNMPPYLAINYIVYTGVYSTPPPDSEIYFPYIYSHTLQSGYILQVPVQASVGQLFNSGLIISLISVLAVSLLVEIHYRRRQDNGAD